MARWMRIGTHTFDADRIVIVNDVSLDPKMPRNEIGIRFEHGYTLAFDGQLADTFRAFMSRWSIDDDPSEPSVSYAPPPPGL